MSPATLEASRDKAVARELAMHAGRISVLSSSKFWEAHQRGLDQIEAGQTVTLEELQLKFGIH